MAAKKKTTKKKPTKKKPTRKKRKVQTPQPRPRTMERPAPLPAPLVDSKANYGAGETMRLCRGCGSHKSIVERTSKRCYLAPSRVVITRTRVCTECKQTRHTKEVVMKE